MTDNLPPVSDFAAKKWEKQNDPAAHNPKDALKAAERFIDENGADHVIVLLGKGCEHGGRHAAFLQAGSFNFFEQFGLIEVGSKQIYDASMVGQG